MSTNVGKIIVELGANVENFEKGFDQAVKSIQGLGNVIRGFQERVGQVGFDKLQAAVMAVPSAFSEATKRVVEMGSRLTDLNTSTGTSVEALQRLEIAGRLVGVGLDASLGAVNLLNRNIVTGSKDATAALKALGLSGEALRHMGADEALAKVGAKLQALPSHADKAAAGMALFGRSWASVAPLVLGGMDSVERRAGQLGVSYAAMTGQMSANTAAAADKLGDNFELMTLSWTGLLDNFGNTVVSSQAVHDAVDGLTVIFANLSEMLGKNQEGAQSLIETGLFLLFETIAFGGMVVTGFLTVLQTLTEGFGLVSGAALNGAAAVARFLAFGAQMAGQFGLAIELRDAASALEQMSGKTQDFAVKAGGGLGKAKDAAALLTVQVHDLANRLGSGTVHLDKTSDAAKKAGAGFHLMSDEARRATDTLTKMGVALNKSYAEAQAGIMNSVAAGMGKIDADLVAKLQSIQVLMDKGGDPQLAQGLMEIARAESEVAKHSLLLSKTQEILGETLSSQFDKVDDVTQIFDLWAEKGRSMQQVLQGLTQDGLRSALDHIEQLVASGRTELIPVMDAISGQMRVLGMHTKEQIAFFRAEDEAADRASAALREHAEALRFTAQSLSELGHGLAELVAEFGGEGIAGQMHLATSLMDEFDQATQDNMLSWGEMAHLVASTVSAFKQATDQASAFGRAMGGAMVGAAAGGKIGGIFGPVGAAWGAVIGGFVGAVAGIFRKPSWVKVGEEAGRVLGFAVSKELAKTIEQTSKDLNVSIDVATLLNLDKAMTEGMANAGKSASDFAGNVMSLMEGVASGTIPAQKGIEQIGKAFTAIKDEAMAAGHVGDATMVGLIKRARELGQTTPEMAAFVGEQVDLAISGLDKMIGAMTSVSAQGAQDQATIFAATFQAALSEKGLVGAFEALGPSFEKLKEQMGSVGGEAAVAILAPFERLQALMANDIFRGAAEGAGALKDIMSGLANAGYLDIATFQALQNQSVLSFGVMTEQGATTKEALLTLAPTIQTAISAAQQFGVPISADMQKLKEMAEQNGITFKTDPMERMATALEAIAVKLGALPAEILKVGDAFGNINPPTISIPFQFVEVGGGLPGEGGGGTNGHPGGGGGGNYQGGHASGYDAIAQSDGYLKFHRGERVNVTPVNGESPMSREIAGQVAAMLGGGGTRSGGGNSDSGGAPVDVRVPVMLDGKALGEAFYQMSKDGRVRVSKEAVVSY